MTRATVELPGWVEDIAIIALVVALVVSTAVLAYERGVAEGVRSSQALETIVRVRTFGDTGSWLAGFAAGRAEERDGC